MKKSILNFCKYDVVGIDEDLFVQIILKYAVKKNIKEWQGCLKNYAKEKSSVIVLKQRKVNPDGYTLIQLFGRLLYFLTLKKNESIHALNQIDEKIEISTKDMMLITLDWIKDNRNYTSGIAGYGEKLQTKNRTTRLAIATVITTNIIGTYVQST